MLTLTLTVAGIALIAAAPGSYPVVLVGLLMLVWALLRVTFRGVARDDRDRDLGRQVREYLDEVERRRRGR